MNDFGINNNYLCKSENQSKQQYNMRNKSFTLRQIASWTSEDSEVQIPALQRGLVWKPRQVELLWDSILRGFPIGSFMLSDVVDEKESGKYYLMDGQQRYNAISIGYNSVKHEYIAKRIPIIALK